MYLVLFIPRTSARTHQNQMSTHNWSRLQPYKYNGTLRFCLFRCGTERVKAGGNDTCVCVCVSIPLSQLRPGDLFYKSTQQFHATGNDCVTRAVVSLRRGQKKHKNSSGRPGSVLRQARVLVLTRAHSCPFISSTFPFPVVCFPAARPRVALCFTRNPLAFYESLAESGALLRNRIQPTDQAF